MPSLYDSIEEQAIKPSSHVVVGALCLGWYGSTIIANLATKAFLQHHGSPILLTFLTFALGALPALIRLPWRDVRAALTPGLVAVGVLHWCNCVLTTVGLETSSVRLVYTIKCLEPCVTLSLTFASLRTLSGGWNTLVALALIPGATLLAVRGDATISWLAIAISGSSTVAASLRTVLFQGDFTRSGQHMDAFLLFSLVNLVSVPLELIMLVVHGRPALPISFHDAPQTQLLLCAVGFTFTYNALSFKIATLISPMAHAVNNSAKRITTVLFGQLVVGEAIQTLQLGGLSLILAIAGLFSINRTAVTVPSEKALPRWKLVLAGSTLGVTTFLVGQPSVSPLTPPHHTSAYLEKCGKWGGNQTAVYSWALADEGDPQNFGDDLSHALFSRILGRPLPSKHQYHVQGTREPFVFGVGSIAKDARNCDTLWGTGVYALGQASTAELLDIRAVRGPWSRRHIMEVSPTQYVPEVYGDPGLLLPHYFPEMKRARSISELPILSRVTVIAHFKHEKTFANDTRWQVVSAKALHWQSVVEAILDSTFVISTSLHGLVVADAFGVPARGLMLDFEEPIFKYGDYYLGSGRPDFRLASSLEEALWLGPEKAIVFDSQRLIRAFPFDRFS